MIARRRAALLPRCYVAYASSSDKRMTASNWTTLLTVSGVFEAERVKVLKADLIFFRVEPGRRAGLPGLPARPCARSP